MLSHSVQKELWPAPSASDGRSPSCERFRPEFSEITEIRSMPKIRRRSIVRSRTVLPKMSQSATGFPSRSCHFFLACISQQLANTQLGFVQLRLRVSHRAIQQFGNLLVLVSLDFVQQENGSVTNWQFLDRAC